jgi:hypothetical protein
MLRRILGLSGRKKQRTGINRMKRNFPDSFLIKYYGNHIEEDEINQAYGMCVWWDKRKNAYRILVEKSRERDKRGMRRVCVCVCVCVCACACVCVCVCVCVVG